LAEEKTGAPAILAAMKTEKAKSLLVSGNTPANFDQAALL
jgi:hypothetical protein